MGHGDKLQIWGTTNDHFLSNCMWLWFPNYVPEATQGATHEFPGASWGILNIHGEHSDIFWTL